MELNFIMIKFYYIETKSHTTNEWKKYILNWNHNMTKLNINHTIIIQWNSDHIHFSKQSYVVLRI